MPYHGVCLIEQGEGMTPARLTFTLVALVALAAPVAQARPRAPRVAVFELELRRVRLSKEVAQILRDYLADRLAATGKYRVVPGAKTRAALNPEQVRSRGKCYAKSCQIRVGQALAADRSLSTRVMRIGRTCTVTATLYNLEQQVTERGANADGRCGEEHIKAALDKVVVELTGGGSGVSPVAAPPPPPGPGTGGVGDQELPPVKAEVGTLAVEGTPKGARIDVKGPSGFRGPKAAGLPYTWRSVPSGRYEVLVRKAKYDEHRSAVQVQTDRTRVVSVKLELSHGSLWVGGTPSGAKVEVTGRGGYAKRWGLTGGFTLRGVPRGPATVKVSRGGYESSEQPVQVQGGKVSRVVVKLKAVQRAPVVSGPVGGTSAGQAGLVWVRIPGGSFRMGSESVSKNAEPVHLVRVAGFYLSMSEVTVGQYAACVRVGACNESHADDGTCWVPGPIGKAWKRDTLPGKFRGNDQPAVCIHWEQAKDFCKWAGGRLPSEAEWEFAARSGGKGWKYPWGNEEATCGRAVMDSGGGGCGKNRTWPVCSKPAGNSEQGVCDLAGNVSEWVEDCWHDNYEGAPSTALAWKGKCTLTRVVRISSWHRLIKLGGIAERYEEFTKLPSADYGFRCAR